MLARQRVSDSYGLHTTCTCMIALERRQGFGCPCTHNEHCRSGFCYRRSCADDQLQGVLAVQLPYPSLRHLVLGAINAQPQHDRQRCSSVYQCGHGRGRVKTCSIRSSSRQYLEIQCRPSPDSHDADSTFFSFPLLSLSPLCPSAF